MTPSRLKRPIVPRLGPRRFLSGLFLWTLFLLGLLIHGTAEAGRPVKVGIFQNFPVVFIDENDKPGGIYVDLLEHIAQRENWDLEYVPDIWENCLKNLATGKIDLMTNITYTRERDEYIDFSRENVLMMWGQVYVQKGLEVQNILGLKDLKVAVLTNGVNAINFKKLVDKFQVPCTLVQVDTQMEVFESIAAGRTQAGVLNNVFGTAHQKDYPVELSPILFNPFSLLFAVPQGKNPELLNRLDTYLANWKNNEDSFYHQTIQRWYYKLDPSRDATPMWILYTLGGGMCILCLLVAWMTTLRHQVRRKTRELETINRELRREIAERHQAESERENLKKQLLHAQKMESIGRLAGGVAHDYNNVVSVIIGFTELAMEDEAGRQPITPHLQEIHSAAVRAADITRQLLAFARKQTISPKELDLNQSINGMLKMLRRLIGEDIDLSHFPGQQLWSVKMDPSQLDQIMANLCVNARDAIEGVGAITLETDNVSIDEEFCRHHPDFKPGEYVILSVNDNGCGMEAQIVDKIFDPFFTTKEMDKGTGLGLATVYGIVKQNKGFITIYSEPGKGTSINIYLPRHTGPSTPVHIPETLDIPPGRGETLLVVEDDLSILKLAQRILERMDYVVLPARTPNEALAKAQNHTGDIDLLLTDVIMPQMNGRELADRLQEFYPGIKQLYMSGYTANIIAHHGVLDQDIQFIQKPFSSSNLKAAVRGALDT